MNERPELFKQFYRTGKEIRIVYRVAKVTGNLTDNISTEVVYGELRNIYPEFLELIDQRNGNIKLVKISEITAISEMTPKLWRENY